MWNGNLKSGNAYGQTKANDRGFNTGNRLQEYQHDAYRYRRCKLYLESVNRFKCDNRRISHCNANSNNDLYCNGHQCRRLYQYQFCYGDCKPIAYNRCYAGICLGLSRKQCHPDSVGRYQLYLEPGYRIEYNYGSNSNRKAFSHDHLYRYRNRQQWLCKYKNRYGKHPYFTCNRRITNFRFHLQW